MFNKPYTFERAGGNATLLPDPVKKLYFRFKAKCRKYFVTLEVFSTGMVAVKYCDIKERDAGNRFDKIYNDGDAFRVITTCLYIMREYWQKNPTVSFTFYAIPREATNALINSKKLGGKAAEKFAKRYKKVRFTIYEYAMLNLFPPRHFIQIRDSKNFLYVLLNKRQAKPKTTLKHLGKFLLDNYDMIFEPDDN